MFTEAEEKLHKLISVGYGINRESVNLDSLLDDVNRWRKLLRLYMEETDRLRDELWRSRRSIVT